MIDEFFKLLTPEMKQKIAGYIDIAKNFVVKRVDVEIDKYDVIIYKVNETIRVDIQENETRAKKWQTNTKNH